MTLPIYEIENGIIEALKQTNRLVLQAPTGSGKSTQVPQMLLKHGLLRNGQLVILQPRRLATRLLASAAHHGRKAPSGGHTMTGGEAARQPLQVRARDRVWSQAATLHSVSVTHRCRTAR